jgi:hypothetical protein
MLCQGLIFETSLDESNLWFSAFVILLLVCCVAFNVKQAISKLFKRDLQSVVVPSAIAKTKEVSHNTLMEICQLNALYQLSRLDELEVDCQGLIDMAISTAKNPFALELPNIKRFLKEQIDVWNEPSLISTISAQSAQGIPVEQDEKNDDWAKHTNDFIMNRSVGVGAMQVVSLGITESPPLPGTPSYPSSPTNSNIFRVDSTKLPPSSTTNGGKSFFEEFDLFHYESNGSNCRLMLVSFAATLTHKACKSRSHLHVELKHLKFLSRWIKRSIACLTR